MNALRQYTTVKDNVIHLHLPDEFNGQEVEIIILSVNSKNEKDALRARWEAFLAGMPEPSISEEELMEEVNAERATRYGAA